MNERVTDELIRPAASQASDSQRPASVSPGMRIDPPHHSLTVSPTEADERPDGLPPSLLQKPAGSSSPRLDARFLNEVSQLAQQLHLQLQSEQQDLESREQTLRDQQSIFEVEKQRFIHQIANDLSQIETQKLQLQKSESTIAERQIDLELQQRQIQGERDRLSEQLSELEARKSSVRDEVLGELQTEFDELDRVKTALREEQDRVQLLKAWLQQRLDELGAENEQLLRSEREKLWQSLTTEWEQRNTAFQREKEEWAKTRELEFSEIEREKALFESTVNSANAEFLAAREAVAAELAMERDSQTRELEAEKREWEQRRNSEQAELQAAKQSLDAEIAQSRTELATLYQQEQASWEESRRQEEEERRIAREAFDAELAQRREEHDEQLRLERTEWEQSFEAEKAAFLSDHAEKIREQTLIEQRIRFQQDHLEKSRAEFEQAQNEHRHQRQVERQRIEEAGIVLIRRLRQIELYRSSIDEREKSLDREQELFERTQKAIANTVDLDRLAFQAERESWVQERQIQQADLRRQKEAMATLAENLESRRTRLDKLRAELEETHRATLEMRLAVEEAWAQLTQSSTQDEARQRVEQTRESLVGYYQQMHDSLEIQRREQFEAISKFERQRAEFAEERQKLTDWFAARDEELREGEERLKAAGIEASSNQAHWLATRDRWLQEKSEAEKLIRRLLTSLGENNRDQSQEYDAVMKLNDAATEFAA